MLTTQSPEKKSFLKEKGVLFSFQNPTALKNLLSRYDTIFLTIAPSKDSSYEDTYLKSAQELKKALTPSIKHLIYTSSTSVYAENQGGIVSEISPLDTHTPYAKILIETEKILHSLPICTTIFRLSEIYGPERSIVKRVQAYQDKVAFGTGNNFANMIHIDDIVHAFQFTLDHKLSGIYNLSDLDHPTRKQMYDHVAISSALPKVEWDPSKTSFHSKNKIVSSQKLLDLGFHYEHPHRLYFT